MIRISPMDLTLETQTALEKLQETVDALPTYADQVNEGKRLFKATRPGASFRPVLGALKQMCSGARRCHYCEDSAAIDVEHIWPKEYYPNLVFSWENYLYGCQRCNRPKASICEVYAHSTGKRISIPQFVKDRGGPPEVGNPLLINPRIEDPLKYMMLDLRDTFFFRPIGLPGSKDWERAKHTIDLLKLNEEDVLPAARYEAYENYVARLEKYAHQKTSGASSQSLEPLIKSLKKMGHPTVWHEMKRQNTRHATLRELFTLAPEALTW